MQREQTYRNGWNGWVSIVANGLAVMVAVIGLVLALSSQRGPEIAPSVSQVPDARVTRSVPRADLATSGHYPYGAHGFDSLLPSQPTTARHVPRTDLTTSGQYPYGAHGFDHLLLGLPVPTRVVPRAGFTTNGYYPYGMHSFESLLISTPAAPRNELIGSGHYPYGAHGFDHLLNK